MPLWVVSTRAVLSTLETTADPVVKSTVAEPVVMLLVKLRVATSCLPVTGDVPPLMARAIVMVPPEPEDWASSGKEVPVVLMLVSVSELAGYVRLA